MKKTSAPTNPLVGWLVDIAAGVRFFSRLPLPPVSHFDDPGNPPPFGRIVRRLALSGIVILAPSAVLLLVLDFLAVPSLVAAAVTVVCVVVVTGALHEDAIGDVADGFGGGTARERKLEIMRDSRVGSYGAAAIAGSLIVRTAALAAIVEASPVLAAGYLLVAGILARSAAIYPWISLEPARREGATASLAAPTVADFSVGMAVALALSLAIGGLLAAPLAAASALGAAWIVARIAEWQIDGHTGDVIGAAEQSAEIAALTALAALTQALM